MLNDNFESCTQATVAELFGVSGPAVRKWELDQGCPRNENRTYNLRDVILWWKAQYEERLEAAEANVESDWLEEKHKWEAKIKEIDHQERKREMIPAAEVRRDVGTIVEQFKTGLLGQPAKLAATLAALDRPEDCQAELERDNRELLADLKAELERLIDGDSDSTSIDG